MKKFETLTAIAAPLNIMNIDTDMIIPKQFLKTIKRTGLGKNLFHEMRTFSDGSVNPDFILHQEPFTQSKILVAGANFGCGSSREHAPWALTDFGIECVIATSFADIFYNNCFENGILPAIVSEQDQEKLISYLDNSNHKSLTVDLINQTIQMGNETINFKIDGFRKQRLLEGLDSIGLSLKHNNAIDTFEQNRVSNAPWLA